MSGTAAMSYRKRFRNAARGVFHLRYGRGFLKYFNTIPTAVVTGLVAVAGSLSVPLTWSRTGQTQTDTFIVEKSANGTTGWTVVSSTVPGTAAGYTVTGLTAAVIQYFRVSAVNELGASAVSATVSATPTA